MNLYLLSIIFNTVPLPIEPDILAYSDLSLFKTLPHNWRSGFVQYFHLQIFNILQTTLKSSSSTILNMFVPTKPNWYSMSKNISTLRIIQYNMIQIQSVFPNKVKAWNKPFANHNTQPIFNIPNVKQILHSTSELFQLCWNINNIRFIDINSLFSK